MERGAVRLTIVGVCFRRPSPRIYRWEGERRSKGAPQVGGILLGVLPNSTSLSVSKPADLG